jgi:hypothetical protein
LLFNSSGSDGEDDDYSDEEPKMVKRERERARPRVSAMFSAATSRPAPVPIPVFQDFVFNNHSSDPNCRKVLEPEFISTCWYRPPILAVTEVISPDEFYLQTADQQHKLEELRMALSEK